MTLRLSFVILLAASVSGAAHAQPAATRVTPTDDEIRKILIERVDVHRQAVGIVAGVVDADGRRIVSYGTMAKNGGPVDGNTVFEVGSITKVFTALLLTDMVQRGEVALSDPVAKYLPPDVKVPERNGRVITLQDLATHMSGLPALPANFRPANPANPYANYSVAQLYAFLSSYQLTRDVDSLWQYSNLGVGLLGHALARRAGTDYETLVTSRITSPLGMTDTRITLSPGMTSRFATGHDSQLNAVSPWDLPTLAGAGALRSTTNDMLTFLAANLGLTSSPLASAMAAVHTVRRATTTPTVDQELGWQIFKNGFREAVWKDGATGGFSTFIGYEAQTGVGVVVMANAFAPGSAIPGVNDIGLHLLNSLVPLNRPPTAHQSTLLAPTILDGLTGRYQLTPAMVLTITHAGNALAGQATGQGAFPLLAESEREFFAPVGDITISFQTDATGRATSLTLHQGGGARQARRID